GPIIQLPTHTATNLGNNNLGLGPTAVVLHLSHDDPWVYGALINNVWSVNTSPMDRAYSNGLLQPFVNYNFGDGYYLVISHHHHELAVAREPAAHAACGRRHRQNNPSREAADKCSAQRLLQRRASGLRARLATARPNPVHVPEVTGTFSDLQR